MVRWFSALAFVLVCFGWALLYQSETQAQGVIIVEGEDGDGGMAPLGGAFAIGDDGSVTALVWKLYDDNGWQKAKEELIQRASSGELVEVVYGVEQAKRVGANDKMTTRVGSVLGALEKQGLYPIDTKLVAEEAKGIEATLKTVHADKANDAVTVEVLMALTRAHAQLKHAAELLDAGKLPEAEKESEAEIEAPVRRASGGK